MRQTATALVFALASAGLSAANAQSATEKIPGYGEASPAERLALLSVAGADKVLTLRECNEAVAALVAAEVGKGKDPKERLELLGRLRAKAAEKLKELNKARKAEKKGFAALREPDSYFQQAVALQFISFAAGPKPTLEALGCLKLVRENTNWSAHHALVLAVVTEAFARDEEFAKADMEGKLRRIKVQAEERGIVSDHERTYLEKAVLAEWLSARLRSGAAAQELSQRVADLRERRMICFFTSSWAAGILKQLDALPALEAAPGPAGG
ncbi:MAG: hypothetical protein D6731_07450 [Planctomycetota bacterium]|nr:MAG: hypothetical protein D6731_07450 [Planctomycetota bacterium]